MKKAFLVLVLTGVMVCFLTSCVSMNKDTSFSFRGSLNTKTSLPSLKRQAIKFDENLPLEESAILVISPAFKIRLYNGIQIHWNNNFVIAIPAGKTEYVDKNDNILKDRSGSQSIAAVIYNTDDVKNPIYVSRYYVK